MDELQDKLANLDLKYKQITLNGNQELEEAKVNKDIDTIHNIYITKKQYLLRKGYPLLKTN